MDQLRITDEQLTEWQAALTGGRYVQGRGQLRKGDTFCCLGVWCDIAAPVEWDEFGNHADCKDMPNHSYAPLSGWATDICAGWNDAGMAFRHIADALPLFRRGLPSDWFAECGGYAVLPTTAQNTHQPYVKVHGTVPAVWR